MTLIAQGQSAAFTELFNRYGSLVLGYGRRLLSDLRSAEDVSQEVWIKVVKAAPSYRSEGKFKSWILTITRHTSFNWIRDRGSILVGEENLEQVAGEAPSLDGLFENREQWQAVQRLVEALPQAQRLALMLNVIEDLSYEQIATEMDLSLDAVKSLIYRARRSILSAAGRVA